MVNPQYFVQKLPGDQSDPERVFLREILNVA